MECRTIRRTGDGSEVDGMFAAKGILNAELMIEKT